MKGILLILVLALGSLLGLAWGQTSGFHVLANTIGDAATSITSNSWMPGIKKILGGIQVSVFNHRIVRANLTLWAFNARNNVWDCGTLVERVPKIVVGWWRTSARSALNWRVILNTEKIKTFWHDYYVAIKSWWFFSGSQQHT